MSNIIEQKSELTDYGIAMKYDDEAVVIREGRLWMKSNGLFHNLHKKSCLTPPIKKFGVLTLPIKKS